MIDWQSTKREFGYGNAKELIGLRRPLVICKCDKCGKTRSIAIRVKSRIQNNQMNWTCPSCIMLSPKQCARTSKQSQLRWQCPVYREARKRSTHALLEDKEFKTRHAESVRQAMRTINMNAILSARYSDQAARDKLRQKSHELFKNQEFRDKHLMAMSAEETRQKISSALKHRWTEQLYREHMARMRAKQLQNRPKTQAMLYKILDDLQATYLPEGPDTTIGFYIFDCLIPNSTGKQILIECQGNYWHSLPKTQQQDKAKFTYIERYFPDYKLIYLWEHEFYQHQKVHNKLKSLLNIDNDIIDFNFDDIKIQKTTETKNFFELYHYLGPGRGGTKIGAYLNDELIAVTVFSKPIRQNLATKFNSSLEIVECSRFCINPAYQKRNFASWFLSRCIKIFRKRLLIAYADTTTGHDGTIYKAAGWKFHHETPPDYWYSDVDGFIMHKKTLYNRAINLKMTEKAFAKKYGFIKIYGGKKLCFVKEV